VKLHLTRRELATAATGAVLVARAAGQSQNPVPTAAEQAQAARDAYRRAAETLAKFDVPMSTEPAFRFKA